MIGAIAKPEKLKCERSAENSSGKLRRILKKLLRVILKLGDTSTLLNPEIVDDSLTLNVLSMIE